MKIEKDSTTFTQEPKNPFSRSSSTITIAESEYNLEYFATEPEKLIDFVFDEEKKIIMVTFRAKSLSDKPDKIWKDVYGLENGVLKLIKKIEGVHTPGYYTEEIVEFKEEK